MVKVSLPHNEDNSEVAKEFTAASMPLHIAVMLFELRIDEAELLVVEATAEVVEAVEATMEPQGNTIGFHERSYLISSLWYMVHFDTCQVDGKYDI